MNRRTFIAAVIASTAAAGLSRVTPRGRDDLWEFTTPGTFHILANPATGARVAVMTGPGEAVMPAQFARAGYRIERGPVPVRRLRGWLEGGAA